MSSEESASASASAPPPASATEPAAEKEAAPKKKGKPGILARIWRGMFGRREDYEERLKYLSKEEASVHARIKKRAQSSRRTVRNLIAFSIVSEVGAVIYALMTRSTEMDWQMRALKLLPMFLLPFLSTAIYSTVIRFTRMMDQKDQKTLEKLRAERKAKIDELKERTNYYSTQQLIQKYDLDPAAKAAAASVLASKLGADSGLKVYLDNQSDAATSAAKSNDSQLTHSSPGLRNRKQTPQNQPIGSTTVENYNNNENINNEGFGPGSGSGPIVVGHYNGPARNDGGWISRLAALLVGEDPAQSYALICGNCYMHNGLAKKEDYEHITYYCPHCNALNTSSQNVSVRKMESPVPVAELESEVVVSNDETVVQEAQEKEEKEEVKEKEDEN
ncbi:hypothetical protein LUZ60_016522 [Juncus effusus]|nr:hypothetical protein LUZ60_016522 [Juncus effusus]